MQRGFANILIVLIVVIVTGVGGYLAYQWANKSPSTPQPNQVACTQDAKECPDGSYVGRTGPNCEFSPCPTPNESTSSAQIMDSNYNLVDTSNGKRYTDLALGFSFDFPNEWELDTCTKSCLYQGEVTLTSNIQTNNPSLIYWVRVYLKKNPEHKNFKDLFTQSYDPGSREGFTYTKEERNGLIVYRTTGILGVVGTNAAVFPTKNNDYIVFILTPYSEIYPDKNQAQAYATFDQILSTFKFLP